MKSFKNSLVQNKMAGMNIINQRKHSINGGPGKENINSGNNQGKLSERKHTKEGSPADSGNRAIHANPSCTFLTGRLLQKQEKVTHQKASGSQDRNSTQDQKERSCTPGSIKEFMAKVRMQSFHLSPKENFKVSFKGKTLKMGSPKNTKPKYTYDYSSKYDGKGVSSSSPKSRQITKESFYSGSNKFMTTDGSRRVKEPLKGSLLSQDTNYYNNGSQDSLLPFNKVKCTPTCVNHPMKKSKFFLTDLEKFGCKEGETTLYSGVCSKCAVRLASSGHPIEEIHPDDNESKKKTFSKLIQKISTVASIVKITKEHISIREDKVFSFYRSQLEILKDIQTHIDKIFTNFIRNSEQIKKALSDDHQKHLTQCSELKSRLTHKEFELQKLAKHLTDHHSNGELLNEFGCHEGQLENFNEALSGTVEDCKALHEMSFTLSKLNTGVLLSAPQIESKLQELIKLRPSDLMFQLPTSTKYADSLGHWADLNKQVKSNLITESSVDTTSWNDCNWNRENLLSFDKKILNESGNKEDDSIDDSPQKESPSKQFRTILDRIDESQAEKMKFYSTILSEENEQLFEIEADSQAFNQQQTPELGVKEQTPAYLKEQLALLQTNYKNFALQKKHMPQETVFGDLKSGNSQEKPFKSGSSQQTSTTDMKENLYSLGSEGFQDRQPCFSKKQ